MKLKKGTAGIREEERMKETRVLGTLKRLFKVVTAE